MRLPWKSKKSKNSSAKDVRKVDPTIVVEDPKIVVEDTKIVVEDIWIPAYLQTTKTLLIQAKVYASNTFTAGHVVKLILDEAYELLEESHETAIKYWSQPRQPPVEKSSEKLLITGDNNAAGRPANKFPQLDTLQTQLNAVHKQLQKAHKELPALSPGQSDAVVRFGHRAERWMAALEWFCRLS